MTHAQETQRLTRFTVAHHDLEKGLNRYAYFKVHNHAIGEELVQDAFAKTWSYLMKGSTIAVMKPFLYNILNNGIVDEYRKHTMSSLDVLLEKGFEPSDGCAMNIGNMLDGKAALLLIPLLPEPYAGIVRMRYAEDLSLEEISLLTGKTKNAIAVQACRGIEKLRTLCKVERK